MCPNPHDQPARGAGLHILKYFIIDEKMLDKPLRDA
jgi:hypothetical protein